MKFAIYKSDTGQIDRILTCLEEHLAASTGAGESALEVADDVDDTTHYVQDGAAVAMPPAPSQWHQFDFVTKAWVDGRSLEQAREEKRMAIEAERDRRLVAPVLVYDGKNLDAGEQDIKNLERKLAAANSRIARGEAPTPGSLVWRDYDNIIHEFPDLATYKDWLDGFVLALEDRNTAAWIWSWTKKAQVDAATSIAELELVVLDD